MYYRIHFLVIGEEMVDSWHLFSIFFLFCDGLTFDSVTSALEVLRRVLVEGVVG